VFITDGHQVRDKLPGIWIIKHFDLERVAVTQLGPPPAVAAVGGDQAHGQAENDSSVFVGEWVCNKGTIITLNADFTAARKDKPNLQGNWGYVNGEAHIDWNQGSRTVLRRDGEGFQKLFWGAGVSMDSPPSDTAPAVKKTPSEPPTPETPSQPAATWRTMGEYPLITGKWAEAEAKGIFVTIRQNGGKFVANCTYKNRKGEVHWHADGTISKDGEITASLVHTKPKGFKSQVRTGKLDPDGKTIKGRSTFDGGQNDFTWTLKEPTE
jgi:hypothetical protein